MIRIRQGTVTEVVETSRELSEIKVNIDGNTESALNYDFLTGPVHVGDTVVLNTTAVHKKLGTGGLHFVMANVNLKEVDIPDRGHIMKLRYTPGQVKCLSVEEEESPYRKQIQGFTSLGGIPVVIGTLHSMLAPIAAGIHHSFGREAKVAYVMTDGAALPIQMSKTVAELKDKGFIQHTITTGNAFGGDFEAVNIYTGLIAAKVTAKADVIIVTMGPGIVGTGTQYGFTGIEQGEIINAVNILEGRAIAVPRISFADKRKRHQGLSHHSLTVLRKIALTPYTLVLPEMEQNKEAFILNQLKQAGISELEAVVRMDGTEALDYLEEKDVKVTTMGRGVHEDREFFLTAGAAGLYAGKIL